MQEYWASYWVLIVVMRNFKLGKVAPITMPYIPPIIIPSLGDVTKLAIQFAKQALERAATAIAKL